MELMTFVPAHTELFMANNWNQLKSAEIEVSDICNVTAIRGHDGPVV